MLHWFASTPIRNTASIGGNVMTGSPISDLNPLHMTMGAHVVLLNTATGATRSVPLSAFYLRYRVTDMTEDEIGLHLLIPYVL